MTWPIALFSGNIWRRSSNASSLFVFEKCFVRPQIHLRSAYKDSNLHQSAMVIDLLSRDSPQHLLVESSSRRDKLAINFLHSIQPA